MEKFYRDLDGARLVGESIPSYVILQLDVSILILIQGYNTLRVDICLGKFI